MPARAPQRLPELGLDPQREYRLGIMGGTFDPVHYGHLVTAEQAREALDLDLVLFMPAGSPAFKDDEVVTSAEDRYAMTVSPAVSRSIATEPPTQPIRSGRFARIIQIT